MPTVEYTKNFKRSLWKKPHSMQARIAEAVEKLGDNPWHPSLQTSRLPAHGPDRWYARIDGGNRLTFDWVGGTVRLWAHCNHDILKLRR